MIWHIMKHSERAYFDKDRNDRFGDRSYGRQVGDYAQSMFSSSKKSHETKLLFTFKASLKVTSMQDSQLLDEKPRMMMPKIL